MLIGLIKALTSLNNVKLKKNNSLFYFKIIFHLLFITLLFSFSYSKKQLNENIISYTLNPKVANLNFYWKNDKQEIFKSIATLKTWLKIKNKELLFACNGGMYMEDNSPLGLYIENGKIIKKINSKSGHGNFYLFPNGIFYVTTTNEVAICKTEHFKNNKGVKFATQSGPMLVVDGIIHKSFTEGSSNLNIRNGVGILPNNNVVFAMSKQPINFYDFANYFKSLGCKNALYLDGFVSRTYCPEKNSLQEDGNFGVIIGIIK